MHHPIAKMNSFSQLIHIVYSASMSKNSMIASLNVLHFVHEIQSCTFHPHWLCDIDLNRVARDPKFLFWRCSKKPIIGADNQWHSIQPHRIGMLVAIALPKHHTVNPGLEDLLIVEHHDVGRLVEDYAPVLVTTKCTKIRKPNVLT